MATKDSLSLLHCLGWEQDRKGSFRTGKRSYTPPCGNVVSPNILLNYILYVQIFFTFTHMCIKFCLFVKFIVVTRLTIMSYFLFVL